MRGNELLNKMELIDPIYVEAADNKYKSVKNIRTKWAAAAACLCFVVAGALAIMHANTSLEPIVIPELSSNMGFEGYMFYDISELDNGNPWDESMNIGSLPVYINGSYDASGAGVPKGMSESEMMDRLNSAASALDLNIDSTEIITDGFAGKAQTVTEVRARTDGGMINVQADGTVVYFLSDEGGALPHEYSFTHSSTTHAEAEQVLIYFADIYSEFLGFEKPVTVSFGDYNIFGEFERSYAVYDASGDDAEDILNYNFRSVSFGPDDDGRLNVIRMYDGLRCAEKLGDYPVISAQEAKERLVSGNYQTSVPEKFPGEEYIGKTELVYRTGRLEEVMLPYYRFYVQLPDDMNMSGSEIGLKTYGAYYVPAISDEYISNMPIYDGSFN